MPTTKPRRPAAFSLATSRAIAAHRQHAPPASPPARARSSRRRGGRPSSMRRSPCSPSAASRRRGSTTWPRAAGVAKGTLYLYFQRQGGAVRGAGARRRVADHGAVSSAAARARRRRRRRARDVLRPVPEGGARHQAQAAAAPHHRRGPALSRHCRVLLSRGRRARPGADARRWPSAPSRSGEFAERRGRALPAAHRRAAAAGGDLGRPVCQDRSARRRRPAARAPRAADGQGPERLRHDSRQDTPACR